METEESFVTQAHLAAIQLAAQCTNLETTTHIRDIFKLNIRRLFKELFQPGLKDDTFVCLDSLLRGIKLRADIFLIKNFTFRNSCGLF